MRRDKYMDKPADYKLAHKMPYSSWKQEWKDYKNYKRQLIRAPERINFTEEEKRAYKIKVAKENVKKSHEKYNNLSQEEKDLSEYVRRRKRRTNKKSS